MTRAKDSLHLITPLRFYILVALPQIGSGEMKKGS
jgi:hypothetical protein